MLPERILMTLLLGGVAIGCVFVLYPFFSAILWAAILTGLPTHQSGQYGLAHDVHNFHTFRNVQSVPRLLKPAGYRTGVIDKLHVQPAEVYPWDVEVKNQSDEAVAVYTILTLVRRKGA